MKFLLLFIIQVFVTAIILDTFVLADTTGAHYFMKVNIITAMTHMFKYKLKMKLGNKHLLLSLELLKNEYVYLNLYIYIFK